MVIFILGRSARIIEIIGIFYNEIFIGGKTMNLIKSPFNIYDLLSYLANGFILIIAVFFLFFNEEEFIANIIEKLSLSIGIIILVIASYIVGHLISMLSSSFFEKIIVKYILGYPSRNFFLKKPAQFKVIKKIFGFYFYKTPYNHDVIDRIENKYKKIFKLDFNKWESFNLCFHHVKENSQTTYNRLLTFISIYGFCRNLSLNFLIIAIMMLVNNYIFFGVGAIVLSYLFFLRYLKFFRQYGDEVYKTFIIL
jgi:hypothetical protein